jgi:putative membrane protein
MARWRVAAYFGGLLASVVALVSPLDALAGVLFSAHMAQHLILVLVAAPLLVLGAPLVPFLWALPRPWRVAVARWTRRPAPRALWLVLTQPVVVLVLHLTALWAWHAPAAYQAALASERVHFLEHASLLGTALLFWWVVIQPHGRRRLGYGGALALVFAAALSGTALAALNAFVDHDWYPAYAASTAAWGLDPLTDQQLAGILMGAPAATIYAAAALALVAACLRASERNAWRREAGGAHSGFVAATSARPVGDD